MSLTTELARKSLIEKWVSLRNAAITQLANARNTAFVAWIDYRASLADTTDKAEVSAAITQLRNLAGAIAGNQAATAGQATIDALASFDPPKRVRTPRHAQFIAAAPDIVAAVATRFRLARTDLQNLSAANPADAGDINASVAAVNAALTAISNSDDAAYVAAVALLQV